jgi:hypothetical protein
LGSVGLGTSEETSEEIGGSIPDVGYKPETLVAYTLVAYTLVEIGGSIPDVKVGYKLSSLIPDVKVVIPDVKVGYKPSSLHSSGYQTRALIVTFDTFRSTTLST